MLPQGSHAALRQLNPLLQAFDAPQHGCPSPPQTVQDPSSHVPPALHVEPPQQGCPIPPQETHEPLLHVLPAPQLPPLQHG